MGKKSGFKWTKTHTIGLILVAVMLLGAYTAVGQGQAAYTLKDYYASGTHWYNVNNTDVLGTVDIDDGVFTTTPSGPASQLVFEMDFTFGDIISKGIDKIFVDLTDLELNSSLFDDGEARIELSDGTYTYKIGEFSDTGIDTTEVFYLDMDKIDKFNENARVDLIVTFYDKNGNEANVVLGGIKQNVDIRFLVGGFGAQMMGILASVGLGGVVVNGRKILKGLAGAVSSIGTAVLFPNSLVLPLAVGVIVIFVVYSTLKKNELPWA
ncbi:MAG: hypothetical protein J7L47_11360 [Candidatus Odinarchaeota archaeon]|nr:hypothetical protein [Candidatus Odinarchaeota archaeon]